MKITLVCVGRPRDPLASAIREYEDRLRHYFPFEVVEVKEATHRGQSVSQVLEEEGARILARVATHNQLIALHRPGKRWSSEDLARHLEAFARDRVPGITFAIGGAYGLSRELLDRADQFISLSAMTLPHEMARLILTEQLYRAGTIARNEPYHKGPRT